MVILIGLLFWENIFSLLPILGVLLEINALWLRGAGVENITISPLCTACRQDLFWSHRCVGSQRGSQGAVILCEEVSR